MHFNKKLILFIFSWIVVCFGTVLHAQKPQLDTKIYYNSNVGNNNQLKSSRTEISISNQSYNDEGFVLKKSSDTLYYQKLNIQKKIGLRKVNAILRSTSPYYPLNKDYDNELDVAQHLFASPSAQTIGKGHVNLSTHFLLLYRLNIGITKNFDIGTGFTLIPKLDAAAPPAGQFALLSSKWRIVDRKHIDVAVGSMSVRSPRQIWDLNFGQGRMMHYLYVASNADYRIFSLSASLGQGYLGSMSAQRYASFYWPDVNYKYTFSLGGSMLIGSQLAIVSENWWANGIFNTPDNKFFGGKPFYPMLGGRYYGDMYSASLGVGNFLIPGVPVFGAFYVDGYYYF